MCVSGRKLSVVGLSVPEASTSVPVSATPPSAWLRPTASLPSDGAALDLDLRPLPRHARRAAGRRPSGARPADCGRADSRRPPPGLALGVGDARRRVAETFSAIFVNSATRSSGGSCPRAGMTLRGAPLEPGDATAAPSRRSLPVDAERAADLAEDDVARAHVAFFRFRPHLLEGLALRRREVAVLRSSRRRAAGDRKRPRPTPRLPSDAHREPRGELVEPRPPGEEGPEAEPAAHGRRRAGGARTRARASGASSSAAGCASGRPPRSARRRSRRWAGCRPCRRRSASASAPRPSGRDRPSHRRGRRPPDRPGSGSCRRRSGCSAACPGTRVPSISERPLSRMTTWYSSGPSGSPGRRGPVEKVV